MDNIISVSIRDEDNYFSQGIKCALVDYFAMCGKKIIFVEKQMGNVCVDLVFSALPVNRHARYCHLASQSYTNNTLFFSIRDKKSPYLSQRSACSLEAGVLYRDEDCSVLFHMLDHALSLRHYSRSNAPCAWCKSGRLTRREHEVLRYLRTGATQTETAEHMRLSVKTVNAHKQSAMRKMELKKKHDFIDWILNA